MICIALGQLAQNSYCMEPESKKNVRIAKITTKPFTLQLVIHNNTDKKHKLTVTREITLIDMPKATIKKETYAKVPEYGGLVLQLATHDPFLHKYQKKEFIKPEGIPGFRKDPFYKYTSDYTLEPHKIYEMPDFIVQEPREQIKIDDKRVEKFEKELERPQFQKEYHIVIEAGGNISVKPLDPKSITEEPQEEGFVAIESKRTPLR